MFEAVQERNRTSDPVQNIGHLFHGSCLASLSHKLRYGLRTTRGSTGGVSLEASTLQYERPRAIAAMERPQYMMIEYSQLERILRK